MFAGSALAAFALVYAIGVVRVWRHAGIGHGITRGQAIAFALGWLTLVVALVALDDLSDTLFAAHMAQHELLILVAAPLVAFSSPYVACLWALPASARLRTPRLPLAGYATAPAVVWLLHAIALWVWHVPSLYDAALAHELLHALEHASFFGSAALFWWGLAHGRYGRAGYGAAVVYVFATAMQSGILGALITFAPHVWYPAYDTAAAARFGLTPLEDQQLAGLLMWVPAGFVFIAGGLYFFAAWLKESERRADLFAAR
ncbi:MAG TPA: cytochrome c oxidase assembly protein [Vicinamibacterales bacterium]|nr:cytochrome c oxidase assembly protein [Vicinamibacterales bacterium]